MDYNMIVKEFYLTRKDGVKLYRTYSDENKYIRKVGTDEVYLEAVDIEGANHQYEETETVIKETETVIETFNDEQVSHP